MTEDRLFESRGRVAVHLAPREVYVPPGESVSVPLVLLNGGAEADFFKLSVQGIPAHWAKLPSPVVRIREGEQRDVKLVIQPPDSSQIRVGRYPLVVRVASHAVPDDVVELQATLTVAGVEVRGPISLLLATNTFSAIPGKTTTIPVVLLNEGDEPEAVQLTAEGIPATWVISSPVLATLSGGQQVEVSVAIRPPPETESRAGRHRFTLQVIKETSPAEVTESECVLTVGTFTAFGAALRPLQTVAGNPTQVIIENRGNFQQVFYLTWRSLNDDLTFDSGMTRELRVPAGETETVEICAVPRRRLLVGGQMSYPFTVRVQSADGEYQDLRGETLARPRFPILVVILLILFILTFFCLALFVLTGADLGGFGLTLPPTLE